MRTIVILSCLFALYSGVSHAQQFVPPNAMVFVEESETVDASPTDSNDDKEYIDFGAAIIAGLNKKKVPVVVVLDEEKADYLIRHTSSRKEDSTGTKVTKLLFGRSDFDKFEGTFMVVSRESSAVIFSYNVKKGNFQSAAEAFAKHFNNHIKDGVKKSKKRG